MGGPKGSKNKTKVVELFVEENNKNKTVQETPEVSVKEKKEKPKKELKFNCLCDICNQKIYCSPFRVDLNTLTGKASYHRECDIIKINLCNECATELNQKIDSWILSKNKQLRKFQ